VARVSERVNLGASLGPVPGRSQEPPAGILSDQMRLSLKVDVGNTGGISPPGERSEVRSTCWLDRTRALVPDPVTGVNVAKVGSTLVRRSRSDLLHVLEADRLMPDLCREHRGATN